MSDYIKREDVLQAIAGLLNVTEQIDSADVVQVVRCKDCKWWDSEDHECTVRDSYGWDYKPTDYCSYGERKDNERK